MTKISTLHKKWGKDPAYKAAYVNLSPEFQLAERMIEVRVKSGLSQDELAKEWAPRSQQLRGWKVAVRCPLCAPCQSLRSRPIVRCRFTLSPA
jgi:hypothetical protein